jgi:hypothetical protein
MDIYEFVECRPLPCFRMYYKNDYVCYYICIMLNRCLMKNNDFKESAPVFTKRLNDRCVEINSTVRLSCQVHGLPVPLVLWYKDNHPVDFTGTKCIILL